MVNPFVRQFLIGWLNLLDSVPDIDLVAHLPSFLGGLFNMLADPKKEIKYVTICQWSLISGLH